MITNLLYRCPSCGGFEWLEQGRCRHCHIPVRVLSRKQVAVNGKPESIALWYAKVKGHALPEGPGGMILESGSIRLSCEAQKGHFTGLSGVHAVLHGREPADTGNLILYRDTLLYQGASLKKEVPFKSISAVTIESNTVIVDRNDGRTLYFDFMEESGKKWEDCIQKAIAEFYHPANIVEFCPKIRFSRSRGIVGKKSKTFHEIRVTSGQGRKNDTPRFSLYLKHLAGSLVRGLLDIQMTGLDNIPRRGPAILAANHVSLLDGIILGACLPRLARFMTKNSQFDHPVVRAILRMGGAFPVRRYRTDVVAVRNALRVLQNGHLMGVFPEGERSWDGRMQPFKKGTLRLILTAGKPVIPMGISGIYELMPRWTHSLKRVPIRIEIGKPMRFASISIVDQTKEDVKLVDRQLGQAIRRLITT